MFTPPNPTQVISELSLICPQMEHFTHRRSYLSKSGSFDAVVCRSTRERTYTQYLPGGIRKTREIKPKLGEKVKGHDFRYTIDFYVHPHMLRRTYITRLILSGADPKTVQYLAGHKNSKVTMDIYAQVMYNTPKDTMAKVQSAFPVQKKKKASEEDAKYGD